MDDKEYWHNTEPADFSWPQTMGEWIVTVASACFGFLVLFAIVAVWLL